MRDTPSARNHCATIESKVDEATQLESTPSFATITISIILLELLLSGE